MMRRPSLTSAVLGLVALTLAAAVAGRIDSQAGNGQTDITPVVIATTGSDTATPSTTLVPSTTATTPTSSTTAPSTSKSSAPRTPSSKFTQVSPTPRDIADDNGGVPDGDNTSGDSGSDGTSDGSDGTSDGSDSQSGSD